jgi:uncharacterized protein YutE (UPF0331/DUF86 family)
MTSLAVIENKASAVRKYLGILERYRCRGRAELETDVDLRGAVERYLYLAAQSAIDLAESVIAHRRLRKPTTYGEVFTILGEAGLLSEPLVGEMVRMAGFRNIVAHDYGDLDYAVVQDILVNRLDGVAEYVRTLLRTTGVGDSPGATENR